MARFYLTNKAVSDLENIWDYTVKTWSEKQAEIYYTQLMDSCQNLAENQDVGKPYSEIKGNLLGFLSGKHIIFYEKLNLSEILIIRILHGSMDLVERLNE